MRAAQLREYHQPLELIERPEPEPVAPRDVVVKVGGAGVCATDLHAHEGEMEGAGLRPPIVLGHENAGWVHAVGPDVTTATAGDAVLVYPPYSCGLCVNCRRGLDMHCDRHQFYGLTRGRRVRRLRARRRALARPAAGRGRAGGGRPPLRRRHHRLPRGQAPAAPARARHDGRRDRRRRRRPHRAPAAEGARRRHRDRDRHRRAAAGARAGARCGRGARRHSPTSARRRTGRAPTSSSTSSPPTRPTPPGSTSSPAAASTRRSATAG